MALLASYSSEMNKYKLLISRTIECFVSRAEKLYNEATPINTLRLKAEHGDCYKSTGALGIDLQISSYILDMH